MSQDQDSVDHELGKQEFGKSTDLPTVTDFGAGYRTRNLAEDNMTEALLEEEKRFQEQIRKDPLIGTVLDDKYHILEVLGFGGMSVVYKAMQEPVERLVAVKTVKFRVDERPDIWRRFEREVKTLSKLSHPNVVTVYDCVIGTDSQPYVVMDYLKGSSLDQVLLEGRLSLEQTYGVAAQICLGVGHAHRHEVIHRDIKPANIMLLDDTASGGNIGASNGSYRLEQAAHRQVKVVDFGLAKLGEDSRKLTHSGELWGSPPYMSPEQISGRECDSRADIYSLVIVIYEILTGIVTFWGANVYELLHCHMHNQPPTLACACPDGQFPVQLENVIARAMAKNPVERFASMIDFKDALEQACLHPAFHYTCQPVAPGRAWSFLDGQALQQIYRLVLMQLFLPVLFPMILPVGLPVQCRLTARL
jgi:serine/threonine-protein kinase